MVPKIEMYKTSNRFQSAGMFKVIACSVCLYWHKAEHDNPNQIGGKV